MSFTVNEWAVIGTASTAAATAVALITALGAVILPIISRAQRAAEEAKYINGCFAEVSAATTAAFALIAEVIGPALQPEPNYVVLPGIVARCRYRAEALEIIAKLPGLTYPAIDSCIAARQALLCLIRGCESAAEDRTAFLQELVSAQKFANTVKIRINELSAQYGEAVIPRAKNGTEFFPDGAVSGPTW